MNPRSNFQWVSYNFPDKVRAIIFSELGKSDRTDHFIQQAETLYRYWHAVKAVDEHEPATAAQEIKECREFINKAEKLLQVCEGLSVTTASLIAQQHCMIHPARETGHSLYALEDILKDFIDAAETNVRDREQYKTKGGPPIENARHEFLKSLIMIYNSIFGQLPSYSRRTSSKKNAHGVSADGFRKIATELCQNLGFRSGELEDALGNAMRDSQTSI